MERDIIPVEVKFGSIVDSPSLSYFARRHASQTPLRLRFSLRDLSWRDGVLDIPLYLAHRTLPLIQLALESAA